MAARARIRFALSISVFVAALRGSEVLLLRRSATGWKDGQLSLPAGGLEDGEDLVHAAARELSEETGLLTRVDTLELAHVQQNISDGTQWLGFYFLARSWQGDPKVAEPDKHNEVRWAPLDDLPTDLIDYVAAALRDIGRGIRVASLENWN